MLDPRRCAPPARNGARHLAESISDPGRLRDDAAAASEASPQFKRRQIVVRALTKAIAQPGSAPAGAPAPPFGWFLYLLGGGLLIAAYYYLVPHIGVGPPWVPRLVFGCAVGASAIAAIAVGIRRNKPGSSAAWWLLLGSQACFLAGDVTFHSYHYVRHDLSFPSPADAFYLGQYPLVIAALLLLIRRRSPHHDRAGLIDALILGTGAALLSWVFLIRPNAAAGVGDLAAATSLAYPVLDIVVLAVALRLVVGGVSKTPAFLLLASSISVLLASDALYAWMQLHGSYAPGSVVEGTWKLSYLCLGAAALHPSMRTLTKPVERGSRMLGWRRLVLLSGAAIFPVVLLVNPWTKQTEGLEGGVVDAAAAILMVLVILGLAESMHAQRKVIAQNLRVEAVLRTRDRELSSEREFLEATLNSMHDGVVAADAKGNITLLNDAMQGLVGLNGGTGTRRAADSVAFFRADGEARMPKAELPISRALAGEQIRDVEAVMFAADGTARTVLASARPLRGGDAAIGAVMTLHDITGRKGFEEMALAKLELERTSQARSDFFSRMSHELRTPLNAILGFGQLLAGGANLSSRDRENVGQILTAGGHLLTLIEAVLEVSRSESGKASIDIEPIDVRRVANCVVDMMAPLAAGRGVTLRIDLPEPVVGLADERRLREVLENLVSNGIKYNVAGGTVVIAAERIDGRLQVRVTDTGHGIPHDQLARLFRPFDRLGAEQSGIEGTGLGLTVVKSHVEAMHGSVQVESTPGTGSAFTVDLPLVTPDPDSDERGPLPPSSPKVLYIEDNPANLELVRKIFERRPRLELLTATDGGVGLEVARRLRPDLVLLDLNLPDTVGEDVLARLRADDRTRHIPVVVVSADASSSRVASLLAAGANDYMAKPVDVSRLLAAVDKALAA
ncbi:MAG: hybrid sensor histidine kinase/response regulator [Gaiellaceae bacterium]